MNLLPALVTYHIMIVTKGQANLDPPLQQRFLNNSTHIHTSEGNLEQHYRTLELLQFLYYSFFRHFNRNINIVLY